MDNFNTNGTDKERDGFAAFAAKRIIVPVVLAVVCLWGLVKILGYFEKPESAESQITYQDTVSPAHSPSTEAIPLGKAIKDIDAGMAAEKDTAHKISHTAPLTHPEKKMLTQPESHATPHEHQQATLAETPHDVSSSVVLKKPAPDLQEEAPDTHDPDAHRPDMHRPDTHEKVKTSHAAPADPHKAETTPKAKGVVFVEALITPIEYELNQRFWGWRPNDIINLTDNVNNFQRGVLEVTRRTTVNLTERISRTGATDAFDPNLEQAMNWFMIKADRYWLPSPESKYRDGIKELGEYKKKLEQGRATFYTRNDNLIPLLTAYEDLLGGCEENLVKFAEDDGEPVSFFMADDYFFYAKGVASALLTILKAIEEEFAVTVESRRGTDVLHHAIEACQHATEIAPILVTNSDLDGILANHRANMAAPISHARFYLGVLIKTLST